MAEVGAFEAKNKLSALLDRVEHGEEIVITRHGRPVAKLVPTTRRDRSLSGPSGVAAHAGSSSAGRTGGFRLGDPQGRSGRIPAVSLILDSSATLAWFYADETTPAIRQVFELLTKGGAWVPSLWRLEVANILEMGIRRGRHDVAFSRATLADLSLLPISLDPETDRQAWDATLQSGASSSADFVRRSLLRVGATPRIAVGYSGWRFAHSSRC